MAEKLRKDNETLVAAKQKVDDELRAEKEIAEKRAQDHAKQIRDAETERHLQTLRCLQDTLSACGGGAGTDLTALAHTDPVEQQRLIANTAVDLVAQADVAIKGMTQSSRNRAEEMDVRARGEKRAREEAAVARTQLHDVAYDLQRFGGNTPGRGRHSPSAQVPAIFVPSGAPKALSRGTPCVPPRRRRWPSWHGPTTRPPPCGSSRPPTQRPRGTRTVGTTTRSLAP